MKKILFLSADDFKEKSIQVIRKTPEAYVKSGWEVTYIVMRDSSLKGNYFYEKPIDLVGVNVIRKEIPGTNFLNLIRNSILSSLFIRLRRYLAIFLLVYYGIKQLKKSNFDVLYGYEQPGSVAAKLIKLIFPINKTKIVLRFQGVVFVKEWLKSDLWYRRITNFDTFYALRGPSDLCIMTNDGSQGDWVLSQLHAKHKNLAFYVNGVDCFQIDKVKECKLNREFKSNNEFLFVSVSRIDDHKRVDRCIRFFNALVLLNSNFNYHYLIIGEGSKKYESQMLVKKLNLESRVKFLGAIDNIEIPYYLTISNAFISMYESSNVGNPLLEAIRLNKLIVTLDNGDTSKWIFHKINGFIFPVNDDLDFLDEDYKFMANEFSSYIEIEEKIILIKNNLIETSNQKLWTWEERFAAELNEVDKILD